MSNYDPKKNEYNINYFREHYKQLKIYVPKDYHSEVLMPAVKKSGLSMNRFVRQAIDDYIEAAGLEE